MNGEMQKVSTSHDLARKLLEMEDLPVMAYCEGGVRVSIDYLWFCGPYKQAKYGTRESFVALGECGDWISDSEDRPSDINENHTLPDGEDDE